MKKIMKLAVQENLVPGKSLGEKLSKLEQYGFEGIELWGRDELGNMIKEIIENVSTSNVKVSTICSGYKGDLMGAERKVREEAMEGVKQRLSWAAELGATGVIVVPTFGEPKICDLSPIYKSVEEFEKKLLIEECKILGKHAEDVGSFVLLEPLNRYETHLIRRLDDAVKICKEVRMDHVRIMADFFHMNIEERSIPESIEAAGEYIAHIHLADSTRELPGYGHTDFKGGFSALKKIGYKRYMALECSIPGPPEVELPECSTYLKRCIDDY
ncbi:MAG: sugar phosphate isomerase/epimerase family protein [Thermoproteota archaeon]